MEDAGTYDLIVIGGGAAGFFGAIQSCERNPGMKIAILEKTNKVLSKVRVSGGGRCNVTHACFNPFELANHYPRGEKSLKEIFKTFHASHMIDWLSQKGVEVKEESDGRMFPVTDRSDTIISLFEREASSQKIEVKLNHAVTAVLPENGLLKIVCGERCFISKNILVAIGGNPKPDFYQWIQRLGHTVEAPIPSLFTFNDSESDFKDLMGVAVPNAHIKIVGSKLSQSGPLLITHWGLSGPSVIKLSAWAATFLHKKDYDFTVLVSWIGDQSEDEARKMLGDTKLLKRKQRIFSNPLSSLPLRLWERLCQRAEIEENKVWGELANRNLNKLLENLIRCPFKIRGKTTFKEEFVTCGGVSMTEIEPATMGSKIINGLYFAGEVLNIDGETGGFNFQSAWSTAYLAAKAVSGSVKKRASA